LKIIQNSIFTFKIIEKLSDQTSHSENKPRHRKKKSGQELPLQEYRLVPVEEWEESQTEESGIDMVELAKHIWDDRVFIAKVTGVLVIIGLLVAILSPVEYETEAMLLPEVENNQSTAGNLVQQYGSLLGISGNFDLGNTNNLSPQLFPKIVESLPFQLKLINERVTFSRYDTTTTIKSFLENIYGPSITGTLINYTIGLPSKIKDSLFPQKSRSPTDIDTTIVHISKDTKELIDDLKSRITIRLDQQTGAIVITTTMPDARAAAEMGNKAIGLLKNYIKEYRTQKSLENLDFVKQQYKRAEDKYKKAQDSLAIFQDRNVNLSTQMSRVELSRLQNERDLKFNVYNSLAQQLEQAKIKVQEQTPVFKILQPVNIPVEKSQPKRTLLMIIFTLIGMLLGILAVFADMILESKGYKSYLE
jgi:uncharacterized protein involved in exopolysaccharide biosynthesis